MLFLVDGGALDGRDWDFPLGAGWCRIWVMRATFPKAATSFREGGGKGFGSRSSLWFTI